MIRLGTDADAVHSFRLNAGQVRNRSGGSDFQMARNVHGAAVIQATLREFVGNTEISAGDPVVEYYQIRVNAIENSPSRVPGDLFFGAVNSENSLTEIGENDPLLASAFDFEFTVEDSDFLEPVLQELVLIDTRAVIGTSDPHVVFIGTPDLVMAGSQDGSSSELRVTQGGYTHNPHAFGTTTFNLILTESEPRGFADVSFTYPMPTAIAKSFVVSPENDPLTACPVNGGGLCAGASGTDAASYNLQSNFGTSAPTTDTTRVSTAAVFLHDDDLSFAAALPATESLSPSNYVFELNEGSSAIDISDHLSFHRAEHQPRCRHQRFACGSASEFAYECGSVCRIEHGDRWSGEFDLTLADVSDADVMATVTVPVIIRTESNDAVASAGVGEHDGGKCPVGERGHGWNGVEFICRRECVVCDD